MEFDTFTLVLLRRGPQAAELSDAELEQIQEQHLAHLQAMRERGAMLVAGPFRDQADESFRGLCLYRTGLEETRRLAEQDPAVKAERLVVEAMTWLAREGELAFPQSRPVT